MDSIHSTFHITCRLPFSSFSKTNDLPISASIRPDDGLCLLAFLLDTMCTDARRVVPYIFTLRTLVADNRKWCCEP